MKLALATRMCARPGRISKATREVVALLRCGQDLDAVRAGDVSTLVQTAHDVWPPGCRHSPLAARRAGATNRGAPRTCSGLEQSDRPPKPTTRRHGLEAYTFKSYATNPEKQQVWNGHGGSLANPEPCASDPFDATSVRSA